MEDRLSEELIENQRISGFNYETQIAKDRLFYLIGSLEQNTENNLSIISNQSSLIRDFVQETRDKYSDLKLKSLSSKLE